MNTSTRRRAALTAYQIGDMFAFAACVCAVLRIRELARRPREADELLRKAQRSTALGATVEGAAAEASPAILRACSPVATRG